ncbi:Hpt domain-containing protein [Crateriforma conspicua]|uniref:Hpt domain-containing protein n=1 Tax=Crateriforma conspicua TaxID=2527996 RepID=UPI0013FD0AAA|nr:Hpt domain-containing protein [Crateriforma conspicua]
MNETQRKRFSDALVRVGDDEEILCELAAIAYEDGQPLLQQLDQAISHQDMEQASRSGHSLKGTLSGFETGHPTTLLQPIIDAARRDDPNEASVLFTKAKPQLHSLLKEIHGISG